MATNLQYRQVARLFISKLIQNSAVSRNLNDPVKYVTCPCARGFPRYYRISHQLYVSEKNEETTFEATPEHDHYETPLQQDDLYPGHIPTSLFQKSLLAVGSAAMCILNPARDDMICALGETTGPNALRYMRQKMLQDPIGRQILESALNPYHCDPLACSSHADMRVSADMRDQPLITTETISIPYLESLPDNTFGKAYWRFLNTNGFSPDARRPVNFIDDPDLMYVMLRYRQLHDLMHTLLDMPTNMLGEVVVKWFEAVQTGLPMCVMGALVGPVRLGPKHRQKYASVFLPWVLRSAANSKFLMSVYFEKNWEKDIDEFRAELNLEPAPATVKKTGAGTLS